MIEAGLGRGEAFLDCFKSYGWYSDDLVLSPVNHDAAGAGHTVLESSRKP